MSGAQPIFTATQDLKIASPARRKGRAVRGLLAALCTFVFATLAHADDSADVAKARGAFLDKMVTEHGFDRDALSAMLRSAAIDQSIIDAISRPAERVVPWYEYRAIFVNDARIAAGTRFWIEHAATIQSISERYGVAPEMLVAIIGVETYFGQRTGKYRVLDSLATLAFAYPPRAKFFSGELEQFLLLTREEGLDPKMPLGSYAGAMGGGQFIPSSFRTYAVDADGDGKRDIWNDWADVLGSIANYFKKNGWKTGEPVVDPATRAAAWNGPEPSNALELAETVGSLAKQGYVFTTRESADAPAAAFALEAQGGGSEFWIGYHNFRVITRYNRSPKYALAAHQLGQAIRSSYAAAATPAAQDGATVGAVASDPARAPLAVRSVRP
jgi:membrane-bound lytic murein transglycosylase B